ncbi:hypothetical protein SSX86_008111 [Deinandra increscens subsp. villosa]|uniref:Mitochondrial import inner membrane translocase subunit TIM22 n=1 Tax=Deinandra increscens subsp. villosa TaxID=3103831 RepID=A0AAP0H4S8_9ASTR
MGEGKKAVLAMDTSKGLVLAHHNPNPVTQLQAKYKELEAGFKDWLAKQSLPVEAAVVTTTSSLQGAAIGGLMGTFTNDLSSLRPPTPPGAPVTPQAMASLQQAQALSGGPFIQARNFAVMTGVNAGISCVMRRLRGKEDVQSSMVAAFGSGAVFTLVSGMGGPNVAANALSSGVLFALMQGGLFKLGEKFSKPPTEDVLYNKTKGMLSSLGLHNYEKNFKSGLLTDTTLPLLTDRQLLTLNSLLYADFILLVTDDHLFACNSALRDVKIPPGPRLLILDHIQREAELNKGKGGRRT